VSPRLPRRRSLARRLLAIGVALLVVVIAGDRVAVLVADTAAATTLQHAENLTDRPSVRIDGFPFLTQLAGGEFDSIHATVHGLKVGDAGVVLRIESLTVHLHHVHVARDLRSARSDYSTATALVTYADLSQALGVSVRYAGAGRVTAVADVGAIPGLTVTTTATAAPRLSGETLEFTDLQVSVDGATVPQLATAYFSKLFGASFPLTGLPFGVQVRALAVGAGGVTVAMVATGLTYQR
jgi:hypothetical protein